MNTSLQKWTSPMVAISALMLLVTTPESWARAANEHEPASVNVVQLKDTRLKIELNATDGDAGIQVFIDSDPWKSMDIY